MEKIGILCDNYKVERFKSKLIAEGFTSFEVSAHKGLTAIAVTVDPVTFWESQKKIQKICQLVELHFSRSN